MPMPPKPPSRRLLATLFAALFLSAAGGQATRLSARAAQITEVPPTPAPKSKPAIAAKPAVLAPPPRRRRPTVPQAKSVSGGGAPTLLWKTLIRRANGSPVVNGNTVYVAAGGQVQAIDAGGRTAFAADTGATDATPAVDETRLYVGTNRGTVYGVSRKAGQILWKWTGGATDAVATTPAFGAGRVYVESRDNGVYALAATTGGRIWSFTRPDGSLGYSSPVFLRGDDPALVAAAAPAGAKPGNLPGDALFVCGDTTLYRIDPATGKETWHTFVGGKSLSTPAVAGGKIFVGGDNGPNGVGGGGGGLAAFAVADGKPLWTLGGKAGKDWFGPPFVSPDGATVYAATDARMVYAVDAATGKVKWVAHLPGGAVAAAPVLDVRRNAVYIVCEGGSQTLVALDARTGAKRWESRTAGPISGAPALSADGNRLYVAGTENGYLYCFALK